MYVAAYNVHAAFLYTVMVHYRCVASSAATERAPFVAPRLASEATLGGALE